MALSRLLGCNVYISEGRNLQLIRRLEELCQRPGKVALANTFVDKPYNRTGLTLLATSIPELSQAVLTVAEAALAVLDLRQHIADHPRLGVVDHISLHPLGSEATLQHAAQAATTIGQQLAVAPFGLPVYYYGAAHPTTGRKLAEIRRQLGYFQTANKANNNSSSISSNTAGWIGSLPSVQQLSHYPPDVGPKAAAPAAGVVTMGAVPWVVNYNVPLHTSDRAAAAAVARAVSTRGGGLPGVEAMALQHGPGVIEVATNLIAFDWQTYGSSNPSMVPAATSSNVTVIEQPAASPAAMAAAAAVQSSAVAVSSVQGKGAGPEQVQAAIAVAAAQHGLAPPGPGYVTNKLPHELVEYARQQLSD